MTTPCGKEGEIATLKENVRWQNETLHEIKIDVKQLLALKWKIVGAVSFISVFIAVIGRLI